MLDFSSNWPFSTIANSTCHHTCWSHFVASTALAPEAKAAVLQVDDTTETDVICTAKTTAELDGLLTVFHTERSADALTNVQNDLPILCEADRSAIAALAKDFEIDFVSLSFTRSQDDVIHARSFMQKIGQGSCKVPA